MKIEPQYQKKFKSCRHVLPPIFAHLSKMG